MPKSFIKEVKCEHCHKAFTKRVFPETKRHYCSNECRRSDKNSYKSEWCDERRKEYSLKFLGKNNPNFGNTWSDEQRENASNIKRQQFIDDPTYAYRAGSANRDVKFSDDRILAMHEHRTSDSHSHKHSDKSKKIIGQKSKEKFTEEFKQKFRKTMEERGHWVPLTEINPYKVYYRDADWIERMVDYYSDADMDCLNMFGFYSATNINGYVRDHILSRKTGYEFNLPAYILRHPCNLQFISHKENISKGFKDRALTYDEKIDLIEALLAKIENFKGSWKENELCLTFIKERRSV